MINDDDAWGAFGSGLDDSVDSFDQSEVEAFRLHAALVLSVTQTLSSLPLNAPLPKLRVSVVVPSPDNEEENEKERNAFANLLLASLQSRGILAERISEIHATTGNSASLSDALVVLKGTDKLKSTWAAGISEAVASEYARMLVAGGVLLMVFCDKSPSYSGNRIAETLRPRFYEWSTQTLAEGRDHALTIVAFAKETGHVQHETCPWLSRTPHQLEEERRRVRLATVPLSADEVVSSRLSEASIQKGVASLESHGYCIFPQLLSAQVCRSLGCLVLEDLHEAIELLRDNQGVDLYHPQESSRDAGTYRELSLREDYRMDLRCGPRLDRLRSQPEHCYRSFDERNGSFSVDGNQNWVVRSDTPLLSNNLRTPFLRGHPDLLEVVRCCMNSSSSLRSFDVSGNWGRFNFDSSAPGTHQDIRVGPLGAIISLPGAAEQALHADTPHLFEISSHLPPHYINAFTPAADSADGVGQTAFVHGSHLLDVASRLLSNKPEVSPWHDDLVRPRLEPGDVLLFDCRILHFGLANSSASIERPILYTNITLSWFTDPKNWDDKRRVFPLDEDRTQNERGTT